MGQPFSPRCCLGTGSFCLASSPPCTSEQQRRRRPRFPAPSLPPEGAASPGSLQLAGRQSPLAREQRRDRAPSSYVGSGQRVSLLVLHSLLFSRDEKQGRGARDGDEGEQENKWKQSFLHAFA